MDGLRWTILTAFNVRPSNTEPLLAPNLEAASPTLMRTEADEVLSLIRG